MGDNTIQLIIIKNKNRLSDGECDAMENCVSIQLNFNWIRFGFDMQIRRKREKRWFGRPVSLQLCQSVNEKPQSRELCTKHALAQLCN